MAPEMVKGEPRGAKADVWSSCCMFLHMLSGCQPWTRYYSCRLYLKVYISMIVHLVHCLWLYTSNFTVSPWLQIANDPPPLREIPPNCSHLTFEVLKAGLQKDPAKRSSASALKEKTARALKEGNFLAVVSSGFWCLFSRHIGSVCMIAVGGLVSPVKGPYAEPLYVPDKPPDSVPLNKSCCEDEEECQYSTVTTAKKTNKLGDDNEEFESKHRPMSHPIMLMSEPDHKKYNLSGVPELELRKLERGEVSHNVLLSSYFSYLKPTDSSLCFCRFLPE